MKYTSRTNRGPVQKKWHESFCLWIDFVGDRSQIGPLLDYIVEMGNDGGGTMLMGPPVSDQSWTFHHRGLAQIAFGKLRDCCSRARWTPYAKIRLIHEDKPLPDPTISFKKVRGRKVTLMSTPRTKPNVIMSYRKGREPKYEVRPPRRSWRKIA